MFVRYQLAIIVEVIPHYCQHYCRSDNSEETTCGVRSKWRARTEPGFGFCIGGSGPRSGFENADFGSARKKEVPGDE